MTSVPQPDPHDRPFFTRLLDYFGVTSRPVQLPGRMEQDNQNSHRKRYSEYSEQDLYDIYDDMDYHHVFSAVLDTYTDESTAQDPLHNRSVWAKSKNPAIVDNIHVGFDNVSLEEEHARLTRSFLKYGKTARRLMLSPGNGVMGWSRVYPANIRLVEDAYGRARGFALVGERYTVEKPSYPFEFIQFELPSKDEFGNKSGSVFRPLLRVYQYLVMSEDQVLQTRAQRGTDRNIVWLDPLDMSKPEAEAMRKEYTDHLRRQAVVDPLDRKAYAQYKPWTGTTDIAMLRGEGENTSVDVLSAAGNIGSLEDLNYWLQAVSTVTRIPRATFSSDGEPVQVSLTKNDIRFARALKRVRRVQVYGYRRLADIHLMLQNIDPDSKDNIYTLDMPPISYAEEIERLEIFRLRVDIASAFSALTSFLSLDKEALTMYLLFEIVGLEQEKVERLVTKGETDDAGLQESATATKHRTAFWSAMNKATKSGYNFNQGEIKAIHEVVQADPRVRARIGELKGLTEFDIMSSWRLEDQVKAQRDPRYQNPRKYSGNQAVQAIYDSELRLEARHFKMYESEAATIRKWLADNVEVAQANMNKRKQR